MKKNLKKTEKEVTKVDGNELLQDRTHEDSMLVSIWYPTLNAIPFVL